MTKYIGTIVEQSLENKEVLKELSVLRTYTDEDWTLYQIECDETVFSKLQQSLNDGPWYIHLWNQTDLIAIFKDKIFKLNKIDKDSWRDAIIHGIEKGIPEEQMDFLMVE